jgi:uncharacterized protein YndB with AHSA1/START domain
MVTPAAVDIRRVLPAPMAEVFRWWTEPALLERWMTPTGSVDAEVDLRVGGRLRIVMKDGAVHIEHDGEYVEIDPPRRLVFTWRSRYTGGASLVTVTLEPDGESSTRIRVVHEQLPPEVAASHGGGWTAMIERLEKEMRSHES